MSLTITREERDALYRRITTRLNGIDDVYRALEDEDWEAAQELGQEFSDLLRFLCTDLGWGEGSEESVRLVTPPDVATRAVGAVRAMAKADGSHFAGERQIAEAHEHEALDLQRTCERLLSDLRA
jgi:hypothetical protein